MYKELLEAVFRSEEPNSVNIYMVPQLKNLLSHKPTYNLDYTSPYEVKCPVTGHRIAGRNCIAQDADSLYLVEFDGFRGTIKEIFGPFEKQPHIFQGLINARVNYTLMQKRKLFNDEKKIIYNIHQADVQKVKEVKSNLHKALTSKGYKCIYSNIVIEKYIIIVDPVKQTFYYVEHHDDAVNYSPTLETIYREYVSRETQAYKETVKLIDKSISDRKNWIERRTRQIAELEQLKESLPKNMTNTWAYTKQISLIEERHYS